MILSIVIPCWNEAEGIATSIATAVEAAETARRNGAVSSWEIVAVDDGSTDSTREIIAAVADEVDGVKLVAHETNLGLGAAIRSGLSAATGDVVLYTDADLPCDLVQDLAKALRLLRVYQADVVAAYRHDRTGEGPRRAVYSAVYNSIVRMAFNLPVRDVNFAFKLMRREVIDAIELHSEGSFIDAEMLIRAHRRKFKIIQFGVDYFPRSRGVSTLSSASTIKRIVKEMALIGRSLEQPVGEAPHAAGERLLVVNADDYGLTPAVSQGILRAHKEGIVTSTSVLVLGRGFNDSARWIADHETLDAGIHLAAVGEDPPLLTSREIPSLVDRHGRLPASWKHFLAAAALGRIDPDDVEREFAAQIDAATAAGITLTHVDTHQHLHLWPSVSNVVISLAKQRGIPAMRVPRSADPLKRAGINRLAARLASRAEAAGLVTPEWAVGLDEAGHMHGSRFEDALALLAGRHPHTAEVGCHPGDADDARSAYRWGYDWDRELEWLTSTEARAAVESAGFVLGNYRDLALRAA